MLVFVIIALFRSFAAQYVITLKPTDSATLSCYSTMEFTKFRNRKCDQGKRPCETTFYYKDTPTEATCQTREESLNITILILSETEPPNSTVPATTPYFRCLVPFPHVKISAGHLLSLHRINMQGKKPRFYTISILPTWDYDYGQEFMCNNTRYVLNTIYACLQFLPSGWPCFTNCTILHKIGITLGVIVIFLTAYMVLCVGLNNLMNFFRIRKYTY